MKLLYLLTFLIFPLYNYGQAPVISYSTPQIYNKGTAISTLTPANTGGSVPAGVYNYTSTYSGTGRPGFANGTIGTASYYQPRDVTVDVFGNTYVVDDNNVIRKITPAGVVSTFAGSGALGSADGTGTAASFRYMLGIITDATGNIYVTDSNNNMIRKITPAGVVTTLAGSGSVGSANGAGRAASFHSPCGITIDVAGNLYVADEFNYAIRKITPAGVVSTLAGTGSYGSADGPANSAMFTQPEDVVADAAGNVYVADSGNSKIRKISTAGIVTTLAGNGSPGKADGTGTAASFNFPTALTIDKAGNLYVADAFNQTIRKVTTGGVVTTIAGSTDGSYGNIDGVGRAAKFSYPYGIGTDGGSLYIADNQNSNIRKISLSGYTITPNLPAGLAFDATTGAISGTPTAASPSTNYTVTAYNNYGSSTTVLNITVTDLNIQTIAFAPLPAKVYGDADFNAQATSSNTTLPLNYISSNTSVAVVSATGDIRITGAGTATITVSQNGNSNYVAATPVSQSITVSKAVLTITADNNVKIYGAPNPAFTFTYSGFVLNETQSVLSQAPVVTSTATALSGIGVYPITANSAAANNYTFNYIPGVLTVNPANLLISGDNKTKQYGHPNPPLTLSYNGFVNGDTFTVLSSLPVVTTTADVISIPGSYVIAVSGVATAANYNIAYADGILIITKATQVITFDAIATKVVGNANFSITATASSGLPITFTSSDPSIASIINGNQINILKAGVVTITASQAGDDKFEAVSITQTLTINPANIKMANTFTPNNDGVNDKWNIVGLETDKTASVIIYNRNGLPVYQSTGYYSTPWNGYLNGKRLPSGTYYYVIHAKNNTLNLSGPITLIY